MSHFTTINIRINDIRALKDAANEMGLTVSENTEARGFGSHRIRGDYVINLNGPFDAAVRKMEDGSGYEVIADLWHGHVESELGKNFGTLKQLYGVHKTMREARNQGMSVRRKKRRDGAVRLSVCQV